MAEPGAAGRSAALRWSRPGSLPGTQATAAAAPCSMRCSLAKKRPPVAADEVPGQRLPHHVAGDAVDGGGGVLLADLGGVNGVLTPVEGYWQEKLLHAALVKICTSRGGPLFHSCYDEGVARKMLPT